MSRLAGSTQIRQFDVCVFTTSPLEIRVLALLEPPSLEVAKHPLPFGKKVHSSCYCVCIQANVREVTLEISPYVRSNDAARFA